MKEIPFTDLKSQQARIRASIEKRISEILDHGVYIMGPEVAELEKSLCKFTGASHCISCASGSDALLMTLMAWGIGPGDAVFVPDFTFFATAEMPALLGATPIFVDIDPRTFLMAPDSLEKAIAKVKTTGILRPKAIIPVDLFGQPANYELILPLAQNHRLLTLEDAAQAFGATRNGQSACNLGCAAAATSFFPAKPLGCYGDGGAIFTNDAELAARLASIRVHGKGADKYDNVRLGINGRLDTIQAAILLAKLEIFEDEIKRRQEAAQLCNQHLASIAEIELPLLLPNSTSVWAQYCILLPASKRDMVAAFLRDRGIPCHIYYPKPLHMLQAFADRAQKINPCPVATQVSERILALPFHPYLSEQTIEKTASCLKEALR